MPFQVIQVLLHLGRQRVQATDNQLEFSLERFFLSELSTLGFELGHALPQSCYTGRKCLLCHEPLGSAIDEPGQALPSLADLALESRALLLLPRAIGVEAACQFLRE